MIGPDVYFYIVGEDENKLIIFDDSGTATEYWSEINSHTYIASIKPAFQSAGFNVSDTYKVVPGWQAGDMIKASEWSEYIRV